MTRFFGSRNSAYLVKLSEDAILDSKYLRNSPLKFQGLVPEQDTLLRNLPNVSIYYLDNVHAKSYLNESTAVVTSMNLHDFSSRNREMGVCFTKADHAKLYEQVEADVNSILQAATFKHTGPQVKATSPTGTPKAYMRSVSFDERLLRILIPHGTAHGSPRIRSISYPRTPKQSCFVPFCLIFPSVKTLVSNRWRFLMGVHFSGT